MNTQNQKTENMTKENTNYYDWCKKYSKLEEENEKLRNAIERYKKTLDRKAVKAMKIIGFEDKIKELNKENKELKKKWKKREKEYWELKDKHKLLVKDNDRLEEQYDELEMENDIMVENEENIPTATAY